MTRRIGHDEKETALEFIRAKGTITAGAEAVGLTYQTIRNEMKRSAIFKRRVEEALSDGKGEIGDSALDRIKWLASEDNKDMRSRLTANLALANWSISGFRGETRIQGKIEHDIIVTTGIPRPYGHLTMPKESIKVIEVKPEDKVKLRELNAGKPVATVKEGLEARGMEKNDN